MILSQNLALTLAYTPIIKDFTCTIEKHTLHALIGPNGTGKTSLLRMLAGVLSPSAGTLQNSAKTCFFPHIGGLLPDHSILDNLSFYKQLWGVQIQDKDILTRVGLAHPRFWQRTARTLSTGQKKRLVMGIILAIQPPFLLWDEPTEGLDAAGTELCCRILIELCAQGSACMVATHASILQNAAHQIHCLPL